MKKIIMVGFFIFSFCVLLSAQFFTMPPRPSWLFDNKKLSMNHFVNFSYTTRSKSMKTLYNNYFTYSLSPQFTFIGNLGYYNTGFSKTAFSNYYRGNILHGLGFEYKPHESIMIRFRYEGMTPLKKQ